MAITRRQFLKRGGLVTAGSLLGPGLFGNALMRQAYAALETNGIPFVNTYPYKPDSPHASVGFDNRAASRQMVDYLIDLGHRDFAIMVGFQKDKSRIFCNCHGAYDLNGRNISGPPPRPLTPFKVNLASKGAGQPDAIVISKA